MDNKLKVNPVLKWAGGKRQLLSAILPKMPKSYNSYCEPFLGGGAVLFELMPKYAILNDKNRELINVYNVIMQDVDGLIEKLSEHAELHCKEYYYKIRELDRSVYYSLSTDVERAARTIYLNRTCYNGLYRVNKNGYFNTPIGRYVNPLILDEKNLRNVNKYFSENSVVFFSGDYLQILDHLKSGDFVYLDPPYDPLSSTAAFTSYTCDGFDKYEQERLLVFCNELSKKGICFMQSNSDTNFIRSLYSDYSIVDVDVKRMINSKGSKREVVKELIITNY